MMQDHARTSRSRIIASLVIAVLAIGAACSTRIASNLTSPAPSADAAVPSASATDSLSVAAINLATSARQPYFDFQVDKPAQVKTSPQIPYPAELRSAGISGTVLVQVVVDEEGMPAVNTFKVLRSAHPGFDKLVMTALSVTGFTPAEVNGRKVSQLVQIPFGFVLDSTGAASGIITPARERALRTPHGERLETPRTLPAPPPANTNVPYFDFQVEKPAMVRPGSTVFPAYPPDLRARSVEGTVLAQFVVDEEGKVDMSTFKLLKSDDPAFAESVREALPRLEWIPAEVSGRKVKQLVQQPFGFALNK